MTDPIAPLDAPAGPVLGRPDQLKLYNEQGQLVETVLIDAGMSYLRTFEWAPRVMSVEFHRGTTAAEIAALLSSAREEGATAERERIAREHCEDAHRQVRLNWHIDPEYERGRLHALDDLYRALQDGPS